METIKEKNNQDSKGPIGLYGIKLMSMVYPEWDLQELRLMLRENWNRRFMFEPFTLYKEGPYAGKYVNVDPNGFRKVKNQGPWPPDSKAFNIFLFGGSTTFNYGLPDDETIASYLQEYLTSELKVPVHVYNFGRAEYYSTQERILFESLLIDGHLPDIAIFVDGLNDMLDMERPYTSEGLQRTMEGKGIIKFLNAISDLPVFRTLNYQMTIWGLKKFKWREGTMKELHRYLTKYANEYLHNQKMIQAISEKYRIKHLFVWQPLPVYKYDFFLRHDIFGRKDRYIFPKYGYDLMESIWKPRFLGAGYLWLADMQQNDPEILLYVDAVHYNAVFSRAIAYEIGKKILAENPIQLKTEKPRLDLVSQYLEGTSG